MVLVGRAEVRLYPSPRPRSSVLGEKTLGNSDKPSGLESVQSCLQHNMSGCLFLLDLYGESWFEVDDKRRGGALWFAAG